MLFTIFFCSLSLSHIYFHKNCAKNNQWLDKTLQQIFLRSMKVYLDSTFTVSTLLLLLKSDFPRFRFAHVCNYNIFFYFLLRFFTFFKNLKPLNVFSHFHQSTLGFWVFQTKIKQFMFKKCHSPLQEKEWKSWHWWHKLRFTIDFNIHLYTYVYKIAWFCLNL